MLWGHRQAQPQPHCKGLFYFWRAVNSTNSGLERCQKIPHPCSTPRQAHYSGAPSMILRPEPSHFLALSPPKRKIKLTYPTPEPQTNSGLQETVGIYWSSQELCRTPPPSTAIPTLPKGGGCIGATWPSAWCSPKSI